jgi:flagellar protein FlaI
MLTRLPNPEGKGEVTHLDLMVNALRMRPDRIVLGEIRRQREAEVLFEAMHTGHAVYSTLHADDALQVKNRLTSPPISLPEQMLGALHLTVVQYRQRRSGIRRTYELAEFTPGERGTGLNVVYKWDARDDKLVKVSNFVRLINEITLHTCFTEKEIRKDIDDKKTILEWMVKQKISGVNNVGRVIASYYRDPERVTSLAAKNADKKQLLGE